MKYGEIFYMRRTSQATWQKPTFNSNVPMLGMRPQLAIYATVRD